MKLSLARLGRLCRKELRETLRDRRTILTLVIMPLLVYPLLSMAINRFLLSAGVSSDEGFLVGVATVEERDWLASLLADPRSQPPKAILEASGGNLAKFRVVIPNELTPIESLKANQLDVAARLKIGDTDPELVEVTSYVGDEGSEAARRILIERLQWLKLSDATQIIEKLVPDFRAFDVQASEVGERTKGSGLGSIIPLVLVLMTITGAVYPAIDLTAGERERGTMEALMASPVPRWWVLLAKYVAVVTVALMTAVANLTAMFATLSLTGLLPLLAGDDGGVGWRAMLHIFLLLVLFSGFFAAVLLSLTSFARSFKEAQAYLIPVMLLALAPAMLTLMPGVELNGPLSVAPLISIVLLARDILAGSVNPTGAFMAVASTVLYAAAALGIAAKLFGSDAVDRSSERSIGSLFRRPQLATSQPSLGEAGLVVALLLPISFVISNALMQWLRSRGDSVDIATQLIFNAVGLIAAFGMIPLVATFLGRHGIPTTYRLRSAPILAFLGAALASLGAWAFAHEAIVLADDFGIALLREDQLERTKSILEKWKTVSPILLLATLALTPAIIEELCFRGYLFSAFSTALSPRNTILLTSVLFGLFHVFVGSTLLVERLIPTTMIGILLGWIAYRTGSVWPGMLLHFLHNGMLELVARYHEKLDFLGQELDGSRHLPLTWLVTAGVLTLVGLLIVGFATRRTQSV